MTDLHWVITWRSGTASVWHIAYVTPISGSRFSATRKRRVCQPATDEFDGRVWGQFVEQRTSAQHPLAQPLRICPRCSNKVGDLTTVQPTQPTDADDVQHHYDRTMGSLRGNRVTAHLLLESIETLRAVDPDLAADAERLALDFTAALARLFGERESCD